MPAIIDLSREVELADTRTPQQIMEDAAVYRVWEKVADLDLSPLSQHDSWLVSSSSLLRKALEEAVKAEEFADFKAILRDACPGEFPVSAEPFWNDLMTIAAEAVNFVWSEYQDRVAILSEFDRFNLKKKLNWQARYQVLHQVEDYRFPEDARPAILRSRTRLFRRPDTPPVRVKARGTKVQFAFSPHLADQLGLSHRTRVTAYWEDEQFFYGLRLKTKYEHTGEGYKVQRQRDDSVALVLVTYDREAIDACGGEGTWFVNPSINQEPGVTDIILPSLKS